MQFQIIPFPNTILKPGEAYWSKLRDGDKLKKILWYCCHVCGMDILINDHTIIENDDGTITIEPSLVCPTEGCKGHYYIKKSQIV